MTSHTWRDHCRTIIARVIAANAGKPQLEIRAELGRAYPYGPRMAAANAAWRDETERQLTGRTPRPQQRKPPRPKAASAGQGDLEL
jgi:hypothetical protein